MELSLPILRRHLAGRRWLLASRGKMLRVLLGTYDRVQTDRVARELRPGMTFFDVGAHAGYFTLLAASLVGPTGRVFAFEPEPHNATALRGNVAANRFAQVTVVQKAAARTDGKCTFARGRGSGTGRLASDGGLEVETVALDSFCATAPGPTALKLDVEGAEVEALEGARATLDRHRPMLFVSTHGDELHRRCVELLTGLGYRFESMGASDHGHGFFARHPGGA